MVQNILQAEIEQTLGEKILRDLPATGKFSTESGKEFFIKSGHKSKAYACEANSLKELLKAKAIKTAIPVCVGDRYIVTEYINEGTADREFFRIFGRQLAQMHRYTTSYYGFREDNYIGIIPQENIAVGIEKNTWVEFYYNKRLLYQYRLAEENKFTT